MRYPKNECIAAKAFASLILDYEFSDYVSCRVLIEDLYSGEVVAGSRQEAIEIFKTGSWRK